MVTIYFPSPSSETSRCARHTEYPYLQRHIGINLVMVHHNTWGQAATRPRLGPVPADFRYVIINPMLRDTMCIYK